MGDTGRMEFVVGPSGERKLLDMPNSRVVAKTLVPDVTVNEVARRHDLPVNHLSTWHRLAQNRKLVVPDLTNADFAPVVLEPDPAPSATAPESAAKIMYEAVILGLNADTSPDRITEIALALSARVWCFPRAAYRS